MNPQAENDATRMLQQCIGHPDREHPGVLSHFERIQQLEHQLAEATKPPSEADLDRMARKLAEIEHDDCFRDGATSEADADTRIEFHRTAAILAAALRGER